LKCISIFEKGNGNQKTSIETKGKPKIKGLVSNIRESFFPRSHV